MESGGRASSQYSELLVMIGKWWAGQTTNYDGFSQCMSDRVIQEPGGDPFSSAIARCIEVIQEINQGYPYAAANSGFPLIGQREFQVYLMRVSIVFPYSYLDKGKIKLPFTLKQHLTTKQL
jgi:hypothetical protein